MQQYNEQMILTGSNDVLKAYGDLMQSFYQQNSNSTEMFLLMGELLLAMRKDLGHSGRSNSLEWFEPMRMFQLTERVREGHRREDGLAM
jgi:hypothetical protein